MVDNNKKLQIDLNCDLGESFGHYTLGMDAELLPLASSCNIACGMHAGDPVVMRETVRLAKAAGVALGAHPGYPDLQGFGRRDMSLSPHEVYSFVLYQVGALAGFCAAEGVALSHVKPHGQLYNRCAIDYPLAQAVAQAVKDFDNGLILVGLANGELIRAGQDIGLSVAQEFFMDRAYTDEGVLVSRALPGALIEDTDFALERVKQVIETGKVESISGKAIEVQADTICVHGDGPQAIAYVARIREELKAAGISIAPVTA